MTDKEREGKDIHFLIDLLELSEEDPTEIQYFLGSLQKGEWEEETKEYNKLLEKYEISGDVTGFEPDYLNEEPSHREVIANIDGRFYSINGYYDSWAGTNWDDSDWKKVYPHTRTVVVYSTEKP